jgi:tetratricopeptide (TPR) repeat protein
LLTVSPEQSRSRLSPPEARRLVLRWFPNSPPLLWHLGQAAFEAQDYHEAAGLMEKLVHLGRTGTYDRSAAFDPGLMGEPALLNLANCYLRLGDLDRAESYFGQVLPSKTHESRARQGYALVQNLRQRK